MQDRKFIPAALAAVVMSIDATSEPKPAARSPYQRRFGVKHGSRARRQRGEPRKAWWEGGAA